MNRTPTRRLLPLLPLLSVLAAASLQLSGCDDSTATPNSSGSGTPTAAPSSGSPSGTRAWTLLDDTPEQAPLDAGAYALTAWGHAAKLAVVEAPEGYQNFGGWTFVSGEESSLRDGSFHAMGYLQVNRVFGDPCRPTRRHEFATLGKPPSTAAEVAAELAAQDGAVTSEPTPVTIGGYHGVHLDYRVPGDVDVNRCQFGIWEMLTTGSGAGEGDGVWRLSTPGERAGIWILDVDHQPVMLSWVAQEGTTPAQVREMDRMVETTRFVDAG